MMTAKQLIRLAIVDDDPKAHNSTRAKANGWVFECYQSTADAFRGIPLFQPDAVLVETTVSGQSSIEFTRRLKELLPTLPIIMFTSRYSTDDICQFIKAGAIGYLDKSGLAKNLIPSVTQAVAGWTVIPQQTLNDNVVYEGNLNAKNALEQLTIRQREVMVLVSDRLSNKEVANVLGLSTGTIHRHLTNIYAKLGTHTRKEAVKRFLSMH